MRPPIPDLHIGLPILVMWLVIIVLIVAGYLLYGRWRRRHPRLMPKETSYSEKLQRRLSKGQDRDAEPRAPGSKSSGSRGKARKRG